MAICADWFVMIVLNLLLVKFELSFQFVPLTCIYSHGTKVLKRDTDAGLFMALQQEIIDCGAALTALGMLLRFVVTPWL